MIETQALLALQSLLGKSQVITNPIELLVYEVDAAQDRGLPEAVVLPTSSEQVRQIADWAHQYQVPLVGRGAGTGLSGGAVAEKGGVIVSFSRLNHLLELDRVGRSARLEPGLINLELDERARAAGLYYPPDPASGRSSTMGGNVAENAGGPHCFKYGVTTNYITGLDFVLSDGRSLRVGGGAYDYPEFDLGSLVTGSEGTLALVTHIQVRLLRQPPAVQTMLAAFASVEEAGKAVSSVIAAGLVPATMEMMDQKIARIVEDYVHPGLPTQAGAVLIVEVDGHASSLEAQTKEISRILRNQGCEDLRLARDEAERQRLWYGRKSAAGAMARLAPAYLLLDGTVPRSQLAQTLEATNSICEKHELRVGYVFHAGDGNLHPFILMYPDDPEQVARVRAAGQEFMEEVTRLGGSITGEHGVGIEKRDYLPLMYTPDEINLMREIKQVFDPDNLMNPGKVFPETTASSTRQETRPITDILEQRVFTPPSLEHAALGLANLGRNREQVVLCGRPPQAEAILPGRVFLSTQALSGVDCYAPEDLYVSAGAGTTLDELQAFLAQDNRQVALRSPWPEATLGGLIAANINSPIRMRYGALRDQILAMQIVLADGRRIRAGRPVVKNVAGYDLPKLMAGSFGSLGLIGNVTLKTWPIPRAFYNLQVAVQDLEQGLEWGSAVLKLALNASGVVLSANPAPDKAAVGENGYLLTYSVEGSPEEVAAEMQEIRGALADQGAPEPQDSQAMTASERWAALSGPSISSDLKVRLGVAPRVLAPFILEQGPLLTSSSWAADLASGLITIAANPDGLGEAQGWLDNLRAAALSQGGYAVVVDCLADWQARLNLWGFQPSTLDIMKKLKNRWDPENILLPGGYLQAAFSGSST